MASATAVRKPAWEVIEGDCVEAMAAMEACSVDAVVCDPPYHLTFMGRSWDHAPSPVESQAMHKRWAREALRVLKPGGHLLAAGGSRTYHRLTAGIEDAGFEIRDCITHLYGSGFPKSHSLREIGRPELGTALKPAAEFWVVARKPLSGTVAQTVLEHGTGALNIDAARVGMSDEDREAARVPQPQDGTGAIYGFAHGTGRNGKVFEPAQAGRWPANCVLSHSDECVPVGTRKVKPGNGSGRTSAKNRGFQTEYVGGEAKDAGLPEAGFVDADGTETVTAWECHPECPVRLLDEQTGTLTSGDNAIRTKVGSFLEHGGLGRPGDVQTTYGDSGGASRFYATFRHQEEPCELASSAEPSSSPDEHVSASADASAQDEQQRRPEDSAATSQAHARCAGEPSSTTSPQAPGATAPQSVGPMPSAPSDPTVSDAGVRSGGCVTASAQRDAQPLPSPGCGQPQLHGQPSTPPPSEQTPSHNPASTVEHQDDTGIMSSTTIPPSSSGSASPATLLDTPGANEHGPTRFRYTPKASSCERNAGLDGFEERDAQPYNERPSGGLRKTLPRPGRSTEAAPRANVHPTVKPIDLMRWLVRLVTPPGGTVLDPFTGSGTTGCAAVLEGFDFIGIEREAEYVAIAEARIAWWAEHPEGMALVKRLEADQERKAKTDAGQLGLFEEAGRASR